MISALFRDALSGIHHALASPGFWTGVGAAVILGILNSIGPWLWERLKQAWVSRDDFDITGYWVGECSLPSYDAKQLEIWRYRRSGELVRIMFFAYDQSGSKPTKWRGGAVCRMNKLSGYYYLLDSHTYESGVVALEYKASRFLGIYAQFDPKCEDEPLYVSPTAPMAYVQVPVELPLVPRIRMAFGRPPLRAYGDVMKLFEDGKKRLPRRRLEGGG
jgi:hypothetical protein